MDFANEHQLSGRHDTFEYNKVNDSFMKLSYIFEKREWRERLQTVDAQSIRTTLIFLDINVPGSNTNNNKNVTYQSLFLSMSQIRTNQTLKC